MDEQIPDLAQRLDRIERQLAELLDRVERIESPSRPRSPTQPTATTLPRGEPPPDPHASAAPPAPRPTSKVTEELFGGRVLAVVGGVAVLLGLIFFLTLAIRNGIIGEGTRVLLAAAGSLLLVGAGWWLYKHKGQTDAAQAAIGAGVAGAFATLATATQGYGFVNTGTGLVLAGAIGAGAVALAVVMESRIVAGIGIVGALVGPVLVDAEPRGGTLAFMIVALLGSTAVVLWRKWSWLSLTAFLVTVPQMTAWASDNEDRVALVLVVAAVYWAVNLVAAAGFEIRTAASSLTLPSTSLALLNAMFTAALGWGILDRSDHDRGASVWIAALAAAHIAIGLGLVRRGVARDIALVVVGIGLVLAGVATALLLDGPALVVAFAAEAVLITWAATASGARAGYVIGVGYFVLAAAAALFEAPPDALDRGVAALGSAVVALVAVAASALSLSRLLPEDFGGEPARITPRQLFEVAAGITGLYTVSILIVEALGPGTQRAQTTLSAFWALLGVGLLVAGLRRHRRQARLAGLALLGLAIAKLFLYDLSTLSSVNRAAAFVVVGVLLLAGAFAYQRLLGTSKDAERDNPSDPA